MDQFRHSYEQCGLVLFIFLRSAVTLVTLVPGRLCEIFCYFVFCCADDSHFVAVKELRANWPHFTVLLLKLKRTIFLCSQCIRMFLDVVFVVTVGHSV